MASRQAPLRVFYIGAGDPVAPRSGMDVVLRAHIAELAASPTLDLTGVFVTPGNDATPAPFGGITGFCADTKNAPRSRKLRHVLGGKLLMNFDFASSAARRAVRAGLRTEPDLVVVDHLQALANVSVVRLLLGRYRLLFIGSDVTPHALAAAAKLRNSRLSKLFLRIEALQALMIEALLLRRAQTVIFISDRDARYYRRITGPRATTLCPVVARDPDDTGEDGDDRNANRVLFIGSPGFPPNRSAIDWIVGQLAPQLRTLGASVIVSLAGGGTREYVAAPASNVEVLGFIDEREMHRLLAQCLCVLSPVVHGSGIKIKVMDAFASGAVVLATAQSLQGFGFMNVEPKLDLDQPEMVAQVILDLAADPITRGVLRAQVRTAWAAHVARRQGALLATVLNAARGQGVGSV